LPINCNPILTLKNLSARIGRQTILHSVDLEIADGECVAIVGGSGAGKTTLLRCLLGVTRPAQPYAGHMIFDGVETDFAQTTKTTKRLGLAYVPQNPDHGFDPLKRLAWQWRQCVRVVVGTSHEDADEEKLFEDLGLRTPDRAFPYEWSRGMQQRLLVAMALLGKPRLLILDEPTSALDPIIAAQVLETVTTYAKSNGVAILIVTHDLALAVRHASRTAIMSGGKIHEFGETRQLIEDPQTPYGQLLAANRHWCPQGDFTAPSMAAE